MTKYNVSPLVAREIEFSTGNYQIMYTLYPQGFISVIAKPHDK